MIVSKSSNLDEHQTSKHGKHTNKNIQQRQNIVIKNIAKKPWAHISHILKKNSKKHHKPSHKPSPHCCYHAGSTPPCLAPPTRVRSHLASDRPVSGAPGPWCVTWYVYMVCIHGMYTWIIFYVCYVMYHIFLPNAHGWSWGLGKTFWWDSDSSIGRYFLAEEMMKWSFNKIIINDILDALSRCQTLLKCWWSDDFALLGRYL